MSWDQGGGGGGYDYDNSSYGGDYSNYGQPQQQPQQPQQRHAQQQPQQQQQHQSFSMGGFDSYGGYGQQPPPQQPPPQQQQFYNPNAYGQAPPGTGYGAPSPSPAAPAPAPGAPPASQPQQPPPPSSFGLSGLGEQAGVNPMVANMAMQYGQDMAAKGQEELRRNLDRYVSLGQLRYYFAVDNLYVGRKLWLLLFPFAHSDWSVKYSQVGFGGNLSVPETN